jgi:hypothetical protein
MMTLYNTWNIGQMRNIEKKEARVKEEKSSFWF